jgi:arsenical pump membrane protein
MLAGYFFSDRLGLPVCLLVAGAAAFQFVLVAQRNQTLQAWKLVKEALWAIVIFWIGMYVVVYGLERSCMMQLFSWFISRFARYGNFDGDSRYGLFVRFSFLRDDRGFVYSHIRYDGFRSHLCQCDWVDLGAKITPLLLFATLLCLQCWRAKGRELAGIPILKSG